MARSIKLRTRFKDGKIEVRALINHPMETGLRKDKKTGKAIAAQYITKVVVTANDVPVMTAHWSCSVSKNPFLSFSYAASMGKSVVLYWEDNTGMSDARERQLSSY